LTNVDYDEVVRIGTDDLADLTGLSAQTLTITGTPASVHADIAAYAAVLFAAKNWILAY
jgi:hypothetical protein